MMQVWADYLDGLKAGQGDTVDTASVDLKLENIMKDIGYAAFVKMCQCMLPRIARMVVKEDVFGESSPDHVLIAANDRSVFQRTKMIDDSCSQIPCTHKDLLIFLKWMGEGFVETYLGPEVSEVANDNQKGGRRKGPFMKLLSLPIRIRDEGNTEILRPGKWQNFLIG